MLKKLLKWTMISIGGLIVIALIFYAIIYFKTEARINKVYSVKVQPLTIPADAAAYERGQRVAQNRACLACHGDNLAKSVFSINEKSPVGTLYAANITSGKGGIHYNDEDWIRVLRHGVNKENKSVWFMPSHEVNHISNEELADLICYLKQQPAVDRVMPAKEIKPLGRVLTFFNKFPLLPAEMIDHNATYQNKVIPTVTAEYGKYLTTTCTGCHGDNFKGAPAHTEGEPAIPDITSTGKIAHWKDQEFIAALRTGKTPDGRQLSDAMPFRAFNYNDDELKSIYMYLHQLK